MEAFEADLMNDIPLVLGSFFNCGEFHALTCACKRKIKIEIYYLKIDRRSFFRHVPPFASVRTFYGQFVLVLVRT